MKTEEVKYNPKELAENIENAMCCARWLVREFENISCDGIASIFERAVKDAEFLIQKMSISDDLPRSCFESIRQKEANMIHGILVRYASIDDEVLRKKILDSMMAAANAGYE
ncbi:hypothetical protein [Micavibrio aeruginosavorus]|uniref:Uncharacterized protein n=1 Tax=Micavibrio aeruginosavorus (strain ARL-13) TaxID=856793 RepID=G2KNR1_MICAA|nr:hypothetical protein [Micavibrio aeruginosavorus]AEP10306.1 hypothetical protein MICA_1998 [Micavibrio aeruginosavorus ARL-13]